MKRALLYEDDVQPIAAGKPGKIHRITWSRRQLGRFISNQMVMRGYFVRKEIITERQGTGRYAKESRHALRPGKIYRGFWADRLLAAEAELSEATVYKLRTGGHKRSPELYTTLKLFKALGIQLVGIPSDTNVAALVKAW